MKDHPGLPGFLDRWLKRPDDEIGRNWIAKALIRAFPDPWISNEFTHARAVLAPHYEQLIVRANRCDGQVLDPQGWKRDQPLLAVAATVANMGFVRTGGSDGRRLLFQALVELIAYGGEHAGLRGVQEFAHALRIELEDLSKNPNSRPANPNFSTVWEAISWFGQQFDRYADSATTTWRNSTSGLLCRALLDPAAPPGTAADNGEDLGGDVIVIAPPQPDSEADDQGSGHGIPPCYWLESQEEVDHRSGRTDEIRAEILGASISTHIPAGRFTPASPTYLTDEQAEHEAGSLMNEAAHARESWNIEAQRQLVARALSLATATQIQHLSRLRWGKPGPMAARDYPGYLSPCGRWFYRPELSPKDSKVARDNWVHIPVPARLAKELQALGTSSEEGGLVFPSGRSALDRVDRISRRQRATPTQLQRALVCRLVTNGRWGASVAQYVAGDDLGIDVAPLHYDRISAADLAIWIAQVTMPWFGEKPSALKGSLPVHFVGSRLVPDRATIKRGLEIIRRDWQSSSKTLDQTIKHRTINLVHGLPLTTAHRANENFAQLTRRDFDYEDGLANIFDKPVSPNWQNRPVALDSQWAEEYRALLGDLTLAAKEYAGTALGRACSAALDGSGPIFLAFDTPSDVHAFGLADYRACLPSELRNPDNYARHYLNNELSKCLPEPLRVAQLGWHGTRAGAFANGSPWSVKTACNQISSKLRGILKAVGWRPLGITKRNELTPLPPISWRAIEKAHRARFNDQLTQHKKRAQERRADAIANMRPKLKALLGPGESDLSLGLVLIDGQLQRAVEQDAPIDLEAKWINEVIFRLAAGDMRSLEAHAARGWLHDLVMDGRGRGILSGAIPNRSHERWPVHPGPFLRSSATALSTARRLDKLVCKSSASRALKTAVKLLLHGGYPELSAVQSVMKRTSRLSTLKSRPGILLIEPEQPPLESDKPGTGVVPAWRHGTLAFHGLAAITLSYWHKDCHEEVDLVAVDAELGRMAGNLLSCQNAEGASLPWLNELVALVRIINSLRMDGVARLIGTGQVLPASASVDRIVALWDDLPMCSGSVASEVPSQSLEVQPCAERKHRDHGLVDQLTAAINEAVALCKSDRKKEARIRKNLEKKIRAWIGAADDYRPEELIALSALVFLTRGGRRRPKLQLTTIQGYIYDVARPLMDALPTDPMNSDSDTWTRAFMAALAQVEPGRRPDRADALENFHWALGRAMLVPDVDFGEVFAFAGRSSYMADAGLLTRSELRWFFDVLGDALDSARSNDASRKSIDFATQRRMLPQVQFSAALRPGEAACLSFANLPGSNSERLRIQKNKFQNLKNANARRCPRLMPENMGIGRDGLLEFAASEKAKFGSRVSGSDPIFHELDDPERHSKTRELLNDISRLLKCATASMDASSYWLRKAAVRDRLELVMSGEASSLWNINHLLTEIGHSRINITLLSYVHDAITPFLRWFRASWIEIGANEIADAAGRDRDVVSRRRGGNRLAGSSTRVNARIAALLDGSPYLGESDASGSIPAPAFLRDGWGCAEPVTPCEVDLALSQVASGLPASAHAAADWPVSQRTRLIRALKDLREQYGVRISSGAQPEEGDRLIMMLPRRLQDDGGLRGLLHDKPAVAVLKEMFDLYLSGLSFGIAEHRLVARSDQWKRWWEDAPVLAKLKWISTNRGCLREARALAGPSGRLGLWPTLRWVMACAWVHGGIVEDDRYEGAEVNT